MTCIFSSALLTLSVQYSFTPHATINLMAPEILYLIRSKIDGQYLVARPRPQADRAESQSPPPGFLLLFKEYADALTYLNAHAQEYADRFAVETIAGTQLGNLLKRWSFGGVGIVQDPLIPRVEFLQQDTSLGL